MAGDNSIAAQIRARFQQLRQEQNPEAEVRGVGAPKTTVRESRISESAATAGDSSASPPVTETPTPPADSGGADSNGKERENESIPKIAEPRAKSTNGNGVAHTSELDAEYARKAGIYEWEQELAGLVGNLLRSEPETTEDQLTMDVIGLVLEEPDSDWYPPQDLNMVSAEIEGSIARVIAAAVQTRPKGAKPTQPSEDQIKPLELNQLYSVIDEWERRPWVWDGILPHSSLSLIVGKSETGKSTLIYALIYAIVKGEEFLGRSCEAGRVLYLAGDPMSEIVAGKTFKGLGLTEGVTVVSEALVMNPTGMQQLREIVKNLKPSLVVADTLAATVEMDVDKYGQSYKAQQPLTKMARDFGPNFLMSHHSQKSAIDSYSVIDAALGSVGVAAVASTRMATKLYKRKGEKFYTFAMSNLRIGRPLEGEFIIYKSDNGLLTLAGNWKSRSVSMDKESILKVLTDRGSLTKRTLWQETRPRPKWEPYNEALDELFAEGKIGITEGKNRTLTYHLKQVY